MVRFPDLGLSEPLLRALEDIGYDEPTPVQAATIPLLLAGRDVLAQARTGTGKTAAFGLPLVERVDAESAQIQALVLAPTRELAVQVATELTRLGRHRRIHVLPIYGGQSYEHQFKALRRGVQIVVATPGRLIDHLRRGTIDLSAARWVVLDEADEMLKLGFLDDVSTILDAVPADRRLALFSATLPGPIADLSARYLSDPERVSLASPRDLTVPQIAQSYYEVPHPFKVEALARLLDSKDPERALVFCATKRMVDILSEDLAGRGYRVEAIHGDISQAQRERVLSMARDGRLDVLVATDVAARGIDIPEMTHVFNFDLPPDPEQYVHRIGRTGRAGRTGEAITIVTPRESREIRFLERATGASISRAEVPTVAEVEALERSSLVERVEVLLQEDGWGPYRPLVEQLAATHDPLNIAAAGLALLAGPVKARPEIPRISPGSGDGAGSFGRPPKARGEWGKGPRAGGPRPGGRRGGPPRDRFGGPSGPGDRRRFERGGPPKPRRRRD